MSKNRKKKKGKVINLPLSPINYLRQRVRKLSIYECWINPTWAEGGLATIFIARKHSNGNIIYGSYLVDLFCLGIKDTSFWFNVTESAYKEFMKDVSDNYDQVSCEYALAHNIIYGSLEYAEDFGFSAHSDFNHTQYLLEEDDENIELIDIEFGKEGKPFIMSSPENNFQKELAILEKTAGPGNYNYVSHEGLDDPDGFNGHDDDESQENDAMELITAGLDTFQEIGKWKKKDWEKFSRGEKEVSLYPVNYVLKSTFLQLFEDKEIDDIFDEMANRFKFDISEEWSPEAFGVEGYPGFDILVNKFVKFDDKLSIETVKTNIAELLSLIEEYPNVPLLHTTLCSYYIIAGNIAEMEVQILATYEAYPDFLLSKLFYIQYLIERDKTSMVPRHMGDNWTIRELQPSRKEFHLNEAISFFQTLLSYYLTTGDIIRTQVLYDILVDEGYEEFISDYQLMDLNIKLNAYIVESKTSK